MRTSHITARVVVAALLFGPAAASAETTCHIATFNIWTTDDADETWRRTLAVVRDMDADVIAFQELGAHLPARLSTLEDLGYGVADLGGGRVVATRWPIGPRSAGGFGVQLRTPDGTPVWIFDVHLRPAPYGPYMLAGIPYGGFEAAYDPADARAVQTVVRLQEQTRGRQVDALLADVASAATDAAIAIVAGDFNEPSHLDWTPAVAKAGRHPVAVAWPASMKLQRAGLVDAFRAVHGDPVEIDGATWSPVYPRDYRNHGVPEPQDRIDLVYATAELRCASARTVGRADDAVADDVEVAGFPSDHRAVLVELVLPEPAP